jgi:hypothetical protein
MRVVPPPPFALQTGQAYFPGPLRFSPQRCNLQGSLRARRMNPNPTRE